MAKIIQNGRPTSRKYPSYKTSPKLLLTIYDTGLQIIGQGMSAEGTTHAAFVRPKL
jgi:hypothetical protein